ncbi:MAG TPA: hypothetical protein VGO80_16415 [Solirubrobacteraceae bacterium]|jgi:hypothetical protein|nr:hypothetical protein [Solirubrobacteraceae bacterium]
MKLRIGSTTALAIAALSFGATSANAGVLVDAAASCDAETLSKPFEPWFDTALYTPLRGGDFETGAAGWTLSGGAAVASGNEPFQVAGPGDASSLAIPAGGSATSPPICVGLEHPTVRFFANRTSGGLLGLGTMEVEVLFENKLGFVNSLPIGVVLPSTGWHPTLPMTVLANLLQLLSHERTAVAFRFTPLLGGSWSIDDIQVDPYQRH